MKKFLLLGGCLLLMAPVCDGEKSVKQAMTIASRAFAHGETIPVFHSCDGKDQSPPLTWTKVPPKTVSLALVMDDPDAPGKTIVHWLAWNIDPKEEGLSANILESESKMIQGTNSHNKRGYSGPCPPSGKHRYYFKLYALDTKLNLPAGASAEELAAAIKNHVIEQSSLMGTFQRMP